MNCLGETSQFRAELPEVRRVGTVAPNRDDLAGLYSSFNPAPTPQYGHVERVQRSGVVFFCSIDGVGDSFFGPVLTVRRVPTG